MKTPRQIYPSFEGTSHNHNSTEEPTIDHRLMLGSSYTTAISINDEDGNTQKFYIFPRLSIRLPGRYKLRFQLLQVVLPPSLLGSSHHVVTEIVSDIFVAYPPKEFPGMMPVTELTKYIE